MRYFAYGTNVNPAVLRRKGLRVAEQLPATLTGYALRFNKQGLREALPPLVGFANIVPRPGAAVHGVVYAMDDDGQQARLDRTERCPVHYRRVRVEVEVAGGTVGALTYRARSAVTADGLLPSRNYLTHILAAGPLLPERYRRRLQRRAAFIGECAACHEGAEIVFHRQRSQLYGLCAPCLGALQIWSDGMRRELSVRELEAVVSHLRRRGAGYPSVVSPLEDVTALGLVDSSLER